MDQVERGQSVEGRRPREPSRPNTRRRRSSTEVLNGDTTTSEESDDSPSPTMHYATPGPRSPHGGGGAAAEAVETSSRHRYVDRFPPPTYGESSSAAAARAVPRPYMTATVAEGLDDEDYDDQLPYDNENDHTSYVRDRRQYILNENNVAANHPPLRSIIRRGAMPSVPSPPPLPRYS